MTHEPSVRFRYRLVTLWDLMTPFRTGAFLNLLEFLHVLRLHKQTADAHGKINPLFLATLPATDRPKALSELKQQQEEWDDLGEVRPAGLKDFTEMESDCIALELVASLATVRRLKNVIARPNSQYSEMRAPHRRNGEQMLLGADCERTGVLRTAKKRMGRDHSSVSRFAN
jgi:hypothetical protein